MLNDDTLTAKLLGNGYQSCRALMGYLIGQLTHLLSNGKCRDHLFSFEHKHRDLALPPLGRRNSYCAQRGKRQDNPYSVLARIKLECHFPVLNTSKHIVTVKDRE